MNSSSLVCGSECGTRKDSAAVLRVVPRSAGLSVPQATRSPKTINANLFEPTLLFPWLKKRHEEIAVFYESPNEDSLGTSSLDSSRLF